MACINSLTKSLSRIACYQVVRSFSACSHAATSSTYQRSSPAQSTLLGTSPTSFLSPPSVFLIPTAGMKQMGKLRRRCKYCFFIMIDERLHVWCDAHPRHKQMQMIPKPKTVIRTTHATQGRIRPW